METAPAISAANVSFSYDASPVLADVSFSIPAGSLAAIVGPNGSGKTTLLKILLGFLTPTGGEVRIAGTTPKGARGLVGYVPQRFGFDRNFPITVSEFLTVSCPSCTEEKIEENLTHLDVKGIAHRQLGTLSGGQLQRVLIVRAMLSDPAILYLDEPSSGIDIEGERSFFELISHLHTEHRATIVMVSHELHVVHRLADQVICINRSLICSGAPEAALTPETIARLYGGEVGLYRHDEKQHDHQT
ncbi:MAG: metal ABC transporter ATP-binding protein [Candidatus Colwellbacteria bacterium]|nr:metal ABC transporter ATP-binding protein [Candidatus Colwellbacteria bacterium]